MEFILTSTSASYGYASDGVPNLPEKYNARFIDGHDDPNNDWQARVDIESLEDLSEFLNAVGEECIFYKGDGCRFPKKSIVIEIYDEYRE